MAVVVAQDSTVVDLTEFQIVDLTEFQINVGQVICNHFIALIPDLFFQNRTLALASKRIDLRRHGLHRVLILVHKSKSITGRTLRILPAKGLTLPQRRKQKMPPP